MGDQAAKQPFVVLPFMPPSSNHIYVTDWRRKMRFLSKEAEAFKRQVITLIQTEKGPELFGIKEHLEKDPTALFTISFNHFFEDDEILNKTWGAVDKNGKPKKDSASTRYKRMDIGTRGKLVEDAFSKAVGVDDSLFSYVAHGKYSCRLVGGVPQIHIYFDRAEPRWFGL